MILRETLSLNLPCELVTEIRARAAKLQQRHGSLAFVAEQALRAGLKITADGTVHTTRRTKGARA